MEIGQGLCAHHRAAGGCGREGESSSTWSSRARAMETTRFAPPWKNIATAIWWSSAATWIKQDPEDVEPVPSYTASGCRMFLPSQKRSRPTTVCSDPRVGFVNAPTRCRWCHPSPGHYRTTLARVLWTIRTANIPEELQSLRSRGFEARRIRTIVFLPRITRSCIQFAEDFEPRSAPRNIRRLASWNAPALQPAAALFRDKIVFIGAMEPNRRKIGFMAPAFWHHLWSATSTSMRSTPRSKASFSSEASRLRPMWG